MEIGRSRGSQRENQISVASTKSTIDFLWSDQYKDHWRQISVWCNVLCDEMY